MSSSPPAKATHRAGWSQRWARVAVYETWTRTEVAKCVLEFVDELYEVLVHDVHLSSLNDAGVMLEEMKEKWR